METPATTSEAAQVAREPSTGTTNRGSLLPELPDDDPQSSSSLSEIDEDRLDSENIENLGFSPRKLASEGDSEAETERLEDSPNRGRNKSSIVLSAATYGTSPSKLAQSTTYDDLEEDDDNESEASPSKPAIQPKSNGIIDSLAEEEAEELETPEKVNGRKRKRVGSLGDIGDLTPESGPSRKRRGSVPAVGRAADEQPVDVPLRNAVTEPTPKVSTTADDETPLADDEQETELAASLPKPKKDTKVTSPRKGKRTRSSRNDTDRESHPPETNGNGMTEEPQAEDEDNADAGEEADEAEATSKLEESMKKTNAMDTLTSLEQQFATLRDRIYDERIANLNKELAQLEGPNPTHPEFLRQLQIITEYRNDKIRHENILFKYKLQSLQTKSKAERAQINSTYFQRAREVREVHLEKLSQECSQVQQDRFQTPDASSEFSVPFPMRRSKQISQQTAYNTEVSVLSGFAKYVGFPAAPEIQPARRQDIDEDLRNMGIRPAPAQHATEPAEEPHG